MRRIWRERKKFLYRFPISTPKSVSCIQSQLGRRRRERGRQKKKWSWKLYVQTLAPNCVNKLAKDPISTMQIIWTKKKLFQLATRDDETDSLEFRWIISLDLGAMRQQQRPTMTTTSVCVGNRNWLLSSYRFLSHTLRPLIQLQLDTATSLNVNSSPYVMPCETKHFDFLESASPSRGLFSRWRWSDWCWKAENSINIGGEKLWRLNELCCVKELFVCDDGECCARARSVLIGSELIFVIVPLMNNAVI